MSYSYTQSQTDSYTYANVRHVNDKILGDLTYLLTRYPGTFTQERLVGWKNDFYHWMNAGYAQSITIQFLRNDECFCEIKYEVKDDGSISTDDNVGRIRGVDLTGAYASVIVSYTSKWSALTSDEQQKFRDDKLELTWGKADKTNYASGLSQKFDKQYSSGSLGIQRSVLGG